MKEIEGLPEIEKWDDVITARVVKHNVAIEEAYLKLMVLLDIRVDSTSIKEHAKNLHWYLSWLLLNPSEKAIESIFFNKKSLKELFKVVPELKFHFEYLLHAPYSAPKNMLSYDLKILKVNRESPMSLLEVYAHPSKILNFVVAKNFRGADLTQTYLRRKENFCFEGARLNGVGDIYLKGCNLRKACFVGKGTEDYIEINLEKCRCEGLRWEKCIVKEDTVTDCDFTGMVFKDCLVDPSYVGMVAKKNISMGLNFDRSILGPYDSTEEAKASYEEIIGRDVAKTWKNLDSLGVAVMNGDEIQYYFPSIGWNFVIDKKKLDFLRSLSAEEFATQFEKLKEAAKALDLGT